MSERLRFGIVGCGVIAATHAQSIADLPNDARLIAVADIVPECAQKLASRYGATAYTSLQEMLQHEALDIVNICTPSGLHCEHACAVMRSGRHVIVEKPMDISLASMDEMLNVQQKMGVKMTIISQHRFDPAAQQVYRSIQEKAFGRLVLGNALIPWWRSQKYYDSGAWRGTWDLDGGGVLMNQAIHSIDLLQWLMGPVKSIYAFTDTLAHRMETEDVAVAVLRFANGAIGTIAATTAAYPGIATRIELFGDSGSAVIENDALAYLHLARDAKEEVGAYGVGASTQIQPKTTATSETTNTIDTSKTPQSQESPAQSVASNPAALSSNSHTLQIADMIHAIRENSTPLVDGHAGRQPVEIILGIYQSARTHQEVTLS